MTTSHLRMQPQSNELLDDTAFITLPTDLGLGLGFDPPWAAPFLPLADGVWFLFWFCTYPQTRHAMEDHVPVESLSARKALRPVVLAVPSPQMRAPAEAAAPFVTAGDIALGSVGSGESLPSEDFPEPESDPRAGLG